MSFLPGFAGHSLLNFRKGAPGSLFPAPSTTIKSERWSRLGQRSQVGYGDYAQISEVQLETVRKAA